MVNLAFTGIHIFKIYFETKLEIIKELEQIRQVDKIILIVYIQKMISRTNQTYISFSIYFESQPHDILQNYYNIELPMKLRKLLKKKSNQSTQPTATDSEAKTSNVWVKHSFIFAQPKSQFMHSLQALVKRKASSLCQSFEEDEHSKQGGAISTDNQNEIQKNPFLLAKTKLLKAKESQKDTNKMNKLYLQRQEEEVTGLPDKKTITWKQLKLLEKKNQKMIVRPLTDRK